MREASCLWMYGFRGECIASLQTVCRSQLTSCLALDRPGYISYLCIMVLSVLVSYGIYRHGNMLRKCVYSSSCRCTAAG